MSGSTWQICEHCGQRCNHYGGDRCPACKRRDKAQAEALAAERARGQEQRGRVGCEARQAAALASFDAESQRIRAAAGCARRGP